MDGRRPSDRCCACGGGTLTEPPPSSPPSTPSAPPPPCHDLTPTNSDAYFLDTDLRGNVIGWNGWLQDSTGEGDGTHDGFLPTGRPVTCADFVPGSANAVMQPNRCSTTWWSDGYRPSDRCCSCGGGSMSPSLPPSPVPPSPAPLAPSPAPLAPLSGRAVGAASADLKSGVGGEFAGPELAAVIAASACCLFVICFRCRRKSHAAMSKAPSVVWVKQPDGSRKLSTHCRQRSRVGDVSSTPGEGGSHLCADADSSRHFEGGGDEGGAQGESSVECDAASGASPSLGKQLSRLASRGVLKSKRSSLSCLDSAAEAAACCNAADGESGWAANDAASAASAASVAALAGPGARSSPPPPPPAAEASAAARSSQRWRRAARRTCASSAAWSPTAAEARRWRRRSAASRAAAAARWSGVLRAPPGAGRRRLASRHSRRFPRRDPPSPEAARWRAASTCVGGRRSAGGRLQG